MSNVIASAFSELQPDEWRREVGFSDEVEAANQRLFAKTIGRDEAITIIAEWLQKYQPCLFGRIAARLGALSYCILTEEHLEQSDEDIRDVIQAARLDWTRQAFEGRKSGFVILVISPRIANAVPNTQMLDFARQLGFLYLDADIKTDEAYLDEIFLEKPGELRTTWKWFTGVNYFAAQGDKRWWQDHRIPGGMAFSINSVGHMVKSEIISKKMKELEALLSAPEEGFVDTKMDSLAKALEVAMRTISLASLTPSGRATELLPLPIDSRGMPACPIELPSSLADRDFTKYRGQYHTDHTLPTDYFLASVVRPTQKEFALDFTYLFHKAVTNPDFITMGEGQRIRADGDTVDGSQTSYAANALSRRSLTEAETILVSENERLVRALSS